MINDENLTDRFEPHRRIPEGWFEAEREIQEAADQIEKLRMKANWAAQNKEFRKAITYLEQIIIIDPDDYEAHVSIAEHYDALGDVEASMFYHEEAENIVLRLAENNPDNVKANYIVAYGYIEGQDYREALPYIQNVERGHYNNPNILFNIALCYDRTNQEEKAIPWYRKTIKAMEASGAKEFAHVHTRLAECLRITGEMEEALDLAERGVEHIQSDPVLWHVIGCSTQILQGDESAYWRMQEALSHCPDSSDLWGLYGRICDETERYEEGENAHRNAIMLDPDEIYHQLDLIENLMDQGRYDEAKKEADDLWNREIHMQDQGLLDIPSTHIPHLQSCIAYSEKRYEDTKIYADRALRLLEGHIKIACEEGANQFELDELRQKQEDLEKCVEMADKRLSGIDPDNDGDDLQWIDDDDDDDWGGPGQAYIPS